MCLTTAMLRANIADKPITCYKVVLYITDLHTGERRFKSHIFNFDYKVGKAYELKPEDFFSERPKNHTSMYYEVHEGFHSYNSVEYARTCYEGRRHFRQKEGRVMYRFALLKCEIPAGAYYWTSNYKFGGGEWSKFYQLCSNKIKVIAWKPLFGFFWRKKLKSCA